MGETAPFWRFSAASYPHLVNQSSHENVAENTKRALTGGNGNASSGVYITV